MPTYKTLVVNVRRIFKAGWRSFWRNSWLSAATVLVMVLTIFVITGLLFFNVLAQGVISELKQKVDISVYFKQDVKEADILDAKTSLEKMPEVTAVQYVSRDQALTSFKEKHKDNSALLEGLKELDQNPLQASLNIKAGSATEYEKVAQFVQDADFAKLVDKINYKQNREIIDKLSNITDAAQRAGLIISLILSVLAVLVAFNTVRLTIYNWRDEISVKRLVGATNWNVRGPFIVEGVLYGISAAIATMIIVFPLVAFLSPKLAGFIPGNDIFSFLKANFFSLLFFQVVVGAVLGALSSFIAIRRYLR